MSLTPTQQILLDAICSQGGGINIHEAKKVTGLSFKAIHETARDLNHKGYRITRLSMGGMLWRLLLSPYDARYDELINKN